MIPVSHVFALSGLLFTIGVGGFLIRRNAIIVFMSIELMLNAVNLAFLAGARIHGGLTGPVVVFFVIAIAAIEAAVGLALIIALFRLRRSVDLEEASGLQG